MFDDPSLRESFYRGVAEEAIRDVLREWRYGCAAERDVVWSLGGTIVINVGNITLGHLDRAVSAVADDFRYDACDLPRLYDTLARYRRLLEATPPGTQLGELLEGVS